MIKSLKCGDTAKAPDAMVCGATLLRHNFLLMTKQFRTDGEVIGYSLGKMFDMSDLVLRGLARVLDMLDGMQGLTNMCVIRGELINPPRVFRQRRLLQKKGDGGTATLKDVPRRWVALDFDSIAAPDDLDRRVRADRLHRAQNSRQRARGTRHAEHAVHDRRRHSS